PPPDSGNVERLGLGSTPTVPGDALGGDGPGLSPPPPPVPDGAGERPVTKRCVGNPPRQTEDPLSPPCVAHFEGDNGGNTYPGVDDDLIRVLVYQSATCCDGVTSRGTEARPVGQCFDLTESESADEPFTVRSFRVLQRHFNARFQAYGRAVGFVVCFDNDDGLAGECPSDEARRAEARELYATYEPFAVMSYNDCTPLTFGIEMAKQGVLNFGVQGARPAAFFQEYAGLIWSYAPSMEQQAAMYATYVCEQVVGQPVAASGNGDNGQPRVLGLLVSGDPGKVTSTEFAREAQRRIEACGGEFDAEGTYPVGNNGYSTGNDVAAAENIARFQQAEVTTIIWPKGYEVKHSQAATRVDYFPEWILAGDLQHDGQTTTRVQDQRSFDGHAFVVTNLPLYRDGQATPCEQAVTEAAPDWPAQDRAYLCGSRPFFYTDTFQLFVGIQVAGPRLTPASLDQGMHAIPPGPSDDPSVPACFYAAGDYTCVKDAASGWWDADADDDGLGCWRMIQDGRRYVAGQWPRGNITSHIDTTADPCHTFGGGLTTYS
ncbi:MAG TPA: hypothetical protein VGA69_12760, partial [Nitriliruptorales bacterium]